MHFASFPNPLKSHMIHSEEGIIAIWCPYPFNGYSYYSRAICTHLSTFSNAHIILCRPGYGKQTLTFLKESDFVITLLENAESQLNRYFLYSHVPVSRQHFAICETSDSHELSPKELQHYYRINPEQISLVKCTKVANGISQRDFELQSVFISISKNLQNPQYSH